MNSTINSTTTTPQKSKQKQQAAVLLQEIEYYEQSANLAQERADYYHMRYGY